jgi:hypothetical protein
LETFAALNRALSASKWVSGVLSIPPTLRRLADDSAYVARIVAGEFADLALGAQPWRCPDCQTTDHGPLDDCAPYCDDCRRHHAADLKCTAREMRLDSERRDREARARVEAFAAERGVPVEKVGALMLQELRRAGGAR